MDDLIMIPIFSFLASEMELSSITVNAKEYNVLPSRWIVVFIVVCFSSYFNRRLKISPNKIDEKEEDINYTNITYIKEAEEGRCNFYTLREQPEPKTLEADSESKNESLSIYDGELIILKKSSVKKQLSKSDNNEDDNPLVHHDFSELDITSYLSTFRIRDVHWQVYYSSVSCHHPSEINKIPWKHLTKEWWRLHTFSKYPRENPCSSILLARQGFVYIGSGKEDDDTIICVFCSSAVKNLDSSVNIENLHSTLNANCPIVKGQVCGNTLMKERDGKLFLSIYSQLNNLNKSERFSSLEESIEQIEDQQPSPLKTDSPREASSSAVSDSHPVQNETERDGALAATALVDQSVGNSAHNSISAQATGHGNASAVVTSHAQSLSFPQQNGESANTGREIQQRVTANATVQPDCVPLQSAPSETPSVQSPVRNLIDESRPSVASPSGMDASAISSINSPQDYTDGVSSAQTASDNDLPPSSETQSDSSQTQRPGASYEKLGIIAARPKRPEYARELTRLLTYEGWPENHHIKKADLSKAGYFYTGYTDCARCFYCGGGLRNWEVGDDVWVEHARWFPKCPFIRQCMGQTFIDVVQDLNKNREMIPYDLVIHEMKRRGLQHAIPKDVKDRTIETERDAAVRTIIDSGFSQKDVVVVAQCLRENCQSIDAAAIYDELSRRNIGKVSSVRKNTESQSISKKGFTQRDQEAVETLQGENNLLRQQSQCKICMDKEVSVVFLPCGHFVSCNDCSFSLKCCPVCRDNIKGVVRAFLN